MVGTRFFFSMVFFCMFSRQLSDGRTGERWSSPLFVVGFLFVFWGWLDSCFFWLGLESDGFREG